jgi:hypothetical protein
MISRRIPGIRMKIRMKIRSRKRQGRNGEAVPKIGRSGVAVRQIGRNGVREGARVDLSDQGYMASVQ